MCSRNEVANIFSHFVSERESLQIGVDHFLAGGQSQDQTFLCIVFSVPKCVWLQKGRGCFRHSISAHQFPGPV